MQPSIPGTRGSKNSVAQRALTTGSSSSGEGLMRSTLEPSAPSCCESASLSEVTSAAGPIVAARSEPPTRLCENGPVEPSNFALTDVQRQFRDTLRQYAEERIA